ncbi:hypothetical protein [Longivirga aurantiaca]
MAADIAWNMALEGRKLTKDGYGRLLHKVADLRLGREKPSATT